MSQNADDASQQNHSNTVNAQSRVTVNSDKGDPLIGSKIDGRFFIESVIGVGGMATAYKARQIDLDRIVVIKVLHGQSDEEGLRRFQREALVLSKLDAPGIVKVFTFGISDGMPYMVMDYVEGESLASLIKRSGPLPDDQVIQIAIQLCSALERAHEQGILHRDIKPSNIMVQASTAESAVIYKAQLLDFGIAKLTDSKAATLTNEGDIFGSPAYMSPEQCLSEGVDARSDIYSLACTIFEMVTGRPPFEGKTAAEVLIKHCNEPIPAFRDRNAGVNSTVELQEIVQKCLRKAPADRLSSMLALKAALGELSENKATTSLALAPTQLSAKRRRRFLLIGTAMVGAIMVGLTTLLMSANTELLEALLVNEENCGLSFLIAPTETLIQKSITRTDRSTDACRALMQRLDRIQKNHEIYKVALPQTLHYVAAHAGQFDYADLSKLNDQVCSYCLDVLKLKQDVFGLGSVPDDLHTLTKHASGLEASKTLSKAESAFTFLYRPFYVFCAFKEKLHSDKHFEELAKDQFDLLLPQFRFLLNLLSQTDPSLAQSHLQFVFDHMVECQSIMGEVQSLTLAKCIWRDLPLPYIIQHFQTSYSFANGAKPVRLLVETCTAYYPIALQLYEKTRTDQDLRDKIITQAFFRHLVMGAIEQRENTSAAQDLEQILLHDRSDKWINAVHVNLTDSKPERYQEFWSEQAKALLTDPALKLQPRQEALLDLAMGLRQMDKREDLELAKQYYDRAAQVLKEHPKIAHRRTRIVFRMLVMNAYFAYQRGDRETAIQCINKFIPQMPKTPEPYLIQRVQEKLIVQMKTYGDYQMIHRLERKLKQESQYSEHGDLNALAEQLFDDH